MLRVIQWATGGVGKTAIEAVLAHPELELVGCYVHSEAKGGQDVGDILGTEGWASPLPVMSRRSWRWTPMPWCTRR